MSEMTLEVTTALSALVRSRVLASAEDGDGGLVVRVAQRRLHEEAVELGLGQPVGAGLLDGVLGGDDHERVADLVGHTVDGDASLLHDLEQGRLRLGRGAVDLVGEHDVGEDRAGVEVEGRLGRVVDRHAGDVARQQVGGELDAAVAALHRAGHRPGQLGLARAGEVLQEQVPLGEHAGQRQADDVLLAEHGLVDVGDHLAERLGEPLGLVGGDCHVMCLSCGVAVGVVRYAGGLGWRGGAGLRARHCQFIDPE